MEKEKIFLTNILRAHIKGNPIVLDDDINKDILYTYSKTQGIEAIVYFQCKAELSDHEDFKKSYALQLYQGINRESQIRVFDECVKGFEYLLVKGPVVAKLYPVPSLREMGDLDILIHKKDRYSIHKQICEKGFLLKNKWKDEWTYTKNGFVFEIHDSLIHYSSEKNKIYDYFNNVWNYVDNGELNWEFHYLYLIVHLLQHFLANGVGLRQFMDIAIVTKEINLNWRWISSELSKLHLLGFAEQVFAFNKRCFEVETPLNYTEMQDDLYELSINRLIDGGIFGNNIEKATNTEISRYMIYGNNSLLKARCIVFLRSVFPPYEEMKKLYYCSYLEKRKYLLCMAWFHRGIIRIRSKKNRKQFKDKLLNTTEESKQDTIFFEKWKLL